MYIIIRVYNIIIGRIIFLYSLFFIHKIVREIIMNKFKKYALLHLLILFASFTGICSKMAAKQPFLSGTFIMWYGLMILILGIYAILWQQILKQMSLTVAFANKAISIVWGMVFGAVIFSEKITFNMILGSLIVMAGIVLVVTDEYKDKETGIK